MKIIIRLAFAALLCATLGSVEAQNRFDYFTPATGVLKGSSTTYVTTAAVAADIKGLWTGTCDATTFLRGDGACASASSSPGGSNTQVQFNNSGAFGGSSNFTWDNTNNALTLNSAAGGILGTATAKPLNLEGGNFLVDTTNASIFLGSNGASGAGGAITLQAGNAATTGGGGGASLSAGNGAGTSQSGGSVSLSAGTPGSGGSAGVIGFYTNGAGTARALVNGDGGITVGSPTGGSQGLGTVNMTGCFVNGVACSTGGASGANPTGTVGLSAVNGSAGTFMRSDAAPPLSQSISPTWTGPHTFTSTLLASQTSGAISINSTNSTSAANLFFQLASTAKGRIGIEGSAGATITGSSAGDLYAFTNGGNFIVAPNSGTGVALKVFSSGGTTVGSPTGGDKGAGTINATNLYVNGTAVTTGGVTQTTGTFTTALVSGCSSGGVGTVHYTKTGNVATITFDNSLLCSSNTTSGQVVYSGLPATIQPTNGILSQTTLCAARGEENSVTTLYSITINSTTNASPGQFTGITSATGANTGSHGIIASTCTYTLD